MTGDCEVQAALAAMLRWGWKPGEFLSLSLGERAFVVAGLEVERDRRFQ
jgi:hypothetical protein